MNKFSILIKWAIRFTFIAILWSYLEKLLGYHSEKISSLLSFGLVFGIIYIIIYYLTLAEIFSKVYNENINYKSAFMNLAVLTLFIAFLSPLPHMVMHNYISPDFFDNAIAMYQNKSVESYENAKQFYTLTGFILNGIQNAFSIGIILSATIPLLFINRSKKNNISEKTNSKNKKVKRKYQ
jgi:flagellar biosynthesis protein FliP